MANGKNYASYAKATQSTFIVSLNYPQLITSFLIVFIVK